MLCLGLAFAWLLLRLPFQIGGAIGRAPDQWLAARAAVELPAAERIRMVTGLTQDGVALLRGAVPADGRLVLFVPYPGREMEGFLRHQFECLKNLLYPEPRDVHFAQGAAALQAHIAGDRVGRLVVLDGTVESAELPVVGEFDLLGELPVGDAVGGGPRLRMRVWRLKRVPA